MIRENLNYMSIVPYLNERRLLLHSEYTTLNDMPDMIGLETNYAKIDRLIAVIPDCGHADFLVRFIDCLRESEHDAGEAHEQLADSLQRALEDEGDSDVEVAHTESELEGTEMWLLVGHGGVQSQVVGGEAPEQRPGNVYMS